MYVSLLLFLYSAREGRSVIGHRLGQFKELRRQVLRAEELNPQLSGLQRDIAGQVPHAAGIYIGRGRDAHPPPASWRRLRSRFSTTRARRFTSHWKAPPAAVSSRRAIKASRATAKAFPTRRPESPAMIVSRARRRASGRPGGRGELIPFMTVSLTEIS